MWKNLTKTILRLKQVATSPTKIKSCLTDLREIERLARNDLYDCLGKFFTFFEVFNNLNYRHCLESNLKKFEKYIICI